MPRNSAAEQAEVPQALVVPQCAHPRCVGSARSLPNTIPYPAHRGPIHQRRGETVWKIALDLLDCLNLGSQAPKTGLVCPFVGSRASALGSVENFQTVSLRISVNESEKGV